MARKIRFSTCALAAGVLLFAADRPAAATPVTYTETIEDLNFTTFVDLFDFSRDLTRTRNSGSGPAQIETDDATIVGEHVLSDNWGFSTFAPFSWDHLFPLDPPAATFTHGSLTLNVIGNEGDLADLVFVEAFPVGALTPGAVDVESTTTFSTDPFGDPDFILKLILADGRLHVEVLPLLLDFMTIRASTVEVTYEPQLEVQEVPEPATAVLIVSGLAAGGWRRYRSRTGQRNA